MTPRNVIACEIRYNGIKIQCSDFRTRKENLNGAWKLLKDELKLRGWAIPQNKLSFVHGGGSVSYYYSY